MCPHRLGFWEAATASSLRIEVPLSSVTAERRRDALPKPAAGLDQTYRYVDKTGSVCRHALGDGLAVGPEPNSRIPK
jgi:hypothetical protein